jgi:hypothetical protein
MLLAVPLINGLIAVRHRVYSLALFGSHVYNIEAG